MVFKTAELRFGSALAKTPFRALRVRYAMHLDYLLATFEAEVDPHSSASALSCGTQIRGEMLRK
ncbi:hypothetical protein CBM2598_U10158 [Cupriavidus taiwanensis]|uniref:Uncharacterized protein n=1 Tax=Cupriavidus taiwanensis TaxID=164546 RepID=A0A7Z7NPY2_9BURK|nr:hypothetical protein CBM2597_U10193 [Cupriavidus taiwanensis]SOZ96348.1 hypothetical protein CBM2598_U10158 [Cupriavidus taiwanensis]SPC25698.1 hypothetical protein CBM2594_U10199 [Cupriavidus taiwanensis]